MKYLAILFLILTTLMGCSPAKAPWTNGGVAALEAKTVALVAQSPEDGSTHAYCTGVWISPSVIITARHCVEDLEIGDSLNYATHGDVYLPGDLHERSEIIMRVANLMAIDENDDLALLRASNIPEHMVAQISLAPIEQGDKTQGMGHSVGLWWSYSSGQVAALRYLDNTLFIQATAPTSPGNSGGGLWNADGYLIGICHGGFPRGQNVNIFIHTVYLDRIMRANRL